MLYESLPPNLALGESKQIQKPLLLEKPLVDTATMTDVNVPQIAQELRSSFKAGKTRSVEWRRSQLKAFKKMIKEGTPAMLGALQKVRQKRLCPNPFVQTPNPSHGPFFLPGPA